MNTPFPAILVELHGAPYHSVMARRCMVVELYPARREALVTVGTALNAEVRTFAKFSQLASTEERARWMVTDALANVARRGAGDPTEFDFLAPAEKTATIKMAGAGA